MRSFGGETTVVSHHADAPRKRSLSYLQESPARKQRTGVEKSVHPNHNADGQNRKQSAVQRMCCARHSPIKISQHAPMQHAFMQSCHHAIMRSLAQTAAGTDPRPRPRLRRQTDPSSSCRTSRVAAQSRPARAQHTQMKRRVAIARWGTDRENGG
jgi:hypothetical protein